MALKCSGVRGQTEVELDHFLLLFARTPIIRVVYFVFWGGRSTEFVVDFLSVWNGEK